MYEEEQVPPEIKALASRVQKLVLTVLNEEILREHQADPDALDAPTVTAAATLGLAQAVAIILFSQLDLATLELHKNEMLTSLAQSITDYADQVIEGRKQGKTGTPIERRKRDILRDVGDDPWGDV